MSGITTYQENAVTTQPSGMLIVLLYDGAIKFLSQAVESCSAGDLTAKGQYIAKAMDIVNELDGALDMDAGGEVAQNLRALYDFMRGHLLKAHSRNDVQMLQDVIGLLEELNESWRAITG